MRFLDILVLFRLDLGQISFTLVENAFATQQLGFLATRIVFYHIVTRACAEIKILRVTYVFRLFDFWIFFRLSFFSFSLLFAAVIDLLLGLLAVKKLLRKRNWDGQSIFSMEQPGIVAGNFALSWVFHSTFWAFLCISKAPFGRSLWSGHHWKDLFLLQKLSIDGANFGQKWWRQKKKKGQGSSRAVTGGTGVNGLKW